MWGVDPQVDGQVGDALRGASHPVRLVLDLLHDGEEVHELLAFAVQELAILGWAVDQLEDERASCDNPRTSRQEVSENKEQSQRGTDAANCGILFYRCKKRECRILPNTHLPTKFSKTDDLPALWPPTTAIWGKSMVLETPSWVKMSCNLFMMGMRDSIPWLPAMARLCFYSLLLFT